MKDHGIKTHKITKPIQLMAVWFVALLLIDSAFLAAACKITIPAWISPTLVISAIVLVPIFLLCVFLMQTVFRKELQEDQFYSEWLKRQEETFKNFEPENIEKIYLDDYASEIGEIEVVENEELESQRINMYEWQKGLFLVHSWRLSIYPDQLVDIVVWLHQHGDGPLNQDKINRVEYELGPRFFDKPQIKRNSDDLFRLEVSAYGPMLCIARVFFKNQDDPIILSRYINFEEAPNKSLQPTAKSRHG